MHPNDRSRMTFMIRYAARHPGRVVPHGRRLARDAVLRLPREARLMVRRTLRAPRVAAALALAVGGVAVAFGLVAFTPATDLAQVLPVAVVITVAARLAAFAALRGAATKH
jgi:hypothetical protein